MVLGAGVKKQLGTPQPGAPRPKSSHQCRPRWIEPAHRSESRLDVIPWVVRQLKNGLTELLCAIALLSTFSAAALQAQLPVGQRVRVESTREANVRSSYVGLLMSGDDSTLVVRTAQADVMIPRSAVGTLWVSQGKSSRKRSAAIGALTGFAVGALWGFLATRDCQTDDEALCFIGPEDAPVTLGVLLAIPGTLVGAIRGGRERWKVHPLR